MRAGVRGLNHHAGCPLATAMKHLTKLPLPPRKRNPSVPEAMEALVMELLTKDPEDRYPPSAAQLIEDLRRAREGLPLTFAGAAGYPETLRELRSAPLSVLADSTTSNPRRRRSVGLRLAALAALLTLLGGLGWDLSRDLEGLKTVGAVKSLEGGGEGGTLVAPKGFVGAGEDGSGKGTGQEVPASASVPPASVSASASASPERQASEPPAPEPRVEPSATSQVPEGSSGSGGQAAGTLNPGGGGESAAHEQYQ